jgi:hypothetical protein
MTRHQDSRHNSQHAFASVVRENVIAGEKPTNQQHPDRRSPMEHTEARHVTLLQSALGNQTEFSVGTPGLVSLDRSRRLSSTLKPVVQASGVNPFHGIFNEGFGGMMPASAERHSIHRAVDSVLLESSAHNRFAISAEGFDG